MNWLLSLDVAVVVLFAAIGRASHDESGGIGAVARTATPFLIALVLGWLVMRAWREPLSIQTGLGILAITAVVGMLLRRFVFADGTAFSFLVIGPTFLAVGLLGWRLVAGWLEG